MTLALGCVYAVNWSDRDHAEISIRRQCELLGVNRSGLCYEPLGKNEENLTLMRLLDEQYTQGFDVNRNRVSRLMAFDGNRGRLS